MRIAYFCQYYTPEVSAPSARVSELAFAWTRAGHRVTVVTGLPNHPTGRVPPEYKRTIFKPEQLNGIEVWRNWLYATPNEGVFRKTLSHLSFMLSTLILTVPRLRGADVVIVSSPSFFVVITACIAHWVWRVPFVFEVRDLWPGVFVELGVLKNRLLIHVLERLELFLYKRAAAVVTVTQAFREHIVSRGVAAHRVHTIPNGVDLKAFRPDDGSSLNLRKELGLTNDFVVLYIGAHGISHGLQRVLDVAGLFGGDSATFVFVGDGAEKRHLVKRAEELGLTNVRFFDSQPRERVPSWYLMADVCLVPLKAIAVFESFIPSKIFEIMACGRPIVASLSGETARILASSEAALVVPPEDVHEMAHAIRRLRDDPALAQRIGARGRAFVEAEYDRNVLAARYMTLLESLVRQ